MWVEPVIGKTKTTYKFSKRYKDPVTGRNRKVSVTLDRNTAASRKKARDLLRAKIAARVPSKSITLQDATSLYNQFQSETVKLSTLTRNKRQMKSLTRILGMSTPLDHLTAGYINLCFAKSGEKNSTLNERLVRLKAFLRWAYAHDYIESVDFLDKLSPRPDSTRKEKLIDKYMEPEELSALLEAMTSQTKWQLLTRFLCLSGLRIGEASALLDADVGPEYINVHATYNNEVGLIDTPKTDASAREVYIQPELEECIREIRQTIRMEKLRFGYQSDLFIPSAPKGGHLHYDAYRKYLGEKTEAVIGRRLTPHACRHTMTSLMAAAGVPLETIARRLGHEDSDVTKKIYFHITRKLREKDNEVLRMTSIL